MPVQIQTLFMMGAFQALVLALLLWLGTHGGGRHALAGMHLRAAALGLQAASYVLFLGLGWLPGVVWLLGGNGLSLIAHGLASLALRVLLQKPRRTSLIVGITLVGWLGVSVFSVIVPDYRARVLWGSVALALYLLLDMRALLKLGMDAPSRARRALLWVCVLALLLLIWRNAMLWFAPEQAAGMVIWGTQQSIYLLFTGMQPLFASIGFLLLYNEVLQQQLHRQARLDPLTGVANRLALDEGFERLLGPQALADQPVGLAIINADQFQHINSRLGYDGGDQALLELVTCIQCMLQEGDVIGRFGGEEFVVLAPARDLSATLSLAERIRYRVETTPLSIDGVPMQLTVSVGATVAMPGEHNLGAVLRRARRALDTAKEHGRNQVMSSAG